MADLQSFQPPLQELHGPDAEETRASRNNLERFQLLQGEAGNLYSTGTQFLSGGLFESLKVLHWSFCSEV